MKNTKLATLALAIAALGAMGHANAQLNLVTIEGTPYPAPYVTYGDANSYSLPVLGIISDAYVSGQDSADWTFKNSITTQNPYFVRSTPGSIQDLTVIGTGSSGTGVTTNLPTGTVDNAYPTPNSDGITYFSTSAPLPTDPGGANEFVGDTADTWDIRLSSLSTFLDGSSTVFMFNNNQTKSGGTADETLAVWLRVTLGDEDNLLPNLNLYLTNGNSKYALVSEGGGGDLFGSAGSGQLGAAVGPIAGDNMNTDYVMSGGALCYTKATLSVVSCKNPDGTANPLATGGPINHNLGADQAVYAVVFPTLDQLMATSGFGGYEFMNIEWRMGCDPATSNQAVNCVSRSLNNGFEQLFITSTARVQVPEPGSLVLLGAALLGLAATRRRKAT